MPSQEELLGRRETQIASIMIWNQVTDFLKNQDNR